MDRDHAEGARLLKASPHERYNDTGLGGTAGTLDGYSFPRSWYEGLVARGMGENNEARRAFEAARREVQADLGCCPDDAKAIAVLGLVHAALGQKEEAMREGEQAASMLPLSLDAYDGPIIATNLAVIYAQVGEKDLAIAQLEELRGLPMGPTAGTLQVEPEWDPLRGDPRFEKLIN
jgi:tetratricopeptide (TPR) repeat protein